MTDQDKPGVPEGPDPDLMRAEAERLVSAGLVAVSAVADRIGAPTRERGGAAAAGYDAIGDMLFGPSGHRRHNVANDSAECCRCPVCRVISAAREPNPNLAERLASGAGTLAEGATRLLRIVAGAATAQTGAPPAARGPAEVDPWAAATAHTGAPPAARGPAEVDPWAAATAPAPAGRAGE